MLLQRTASAWIHRQIPYRSVDLPPPYAYVDFPKWTELFKYLMLYPLSEASLCRNSMSPRTYIFAWRKLATSTVWSTERLEFIGKLPIACVMNLLTSRSEWSSSTTWCCILWQPEQCDPLTMTHTSNAKAIPRLVFSSSAHGMPRCMFVLLRLRTLQW